MAHYLITGHTGFKGSWLTLLLKARGHEVSGLALDPPAKSLFVKAGIKSELTHDARVDIRNREATVAEVKKVSPDFVIHMAAQSLVREGYRRPIETYETNVEGTLNVLHAVDRTPSVRAQLIVTTDKVYKDLGLGRPYVETDPLGGKDPYSASKAMADILSQQWFSRAGVTPGAIARAGNVIGAGDYSQDRLIPDIHRAFLAASPLQVRYPRTVRPWQHVLDCLHGYMLLLGRVVNGEPGDAWNFGPAADQFRTVEQLICEVREVSGIMLPVVIGNLDGFHEAPFLALNSSRTRQILDWKPLYAFEDAVRMSVIELSKNSTGTLRDAVREQVRNHRDSLGGAQSQWV